MSILNRKGQRTKEGNWKGEYRVKKRREQGGEIETTGEGASKNTLEEKGRKDRKKKGEKVKGKREQGMLRVAGCSRAGQRLLKETEVAGSSVAGEHTDRGFYTCAKPVNVQEEESRM